MKVQVMTLKLAVRSEFMHLHCTFGGKKHINEVIKLLMITNLEVYYL